MANSLASTVSLLANNYQVTLVCTGKKISSVSKVYKAIKNFEVPTAFTQEKVYPDSAVCKETITSTEFMVYMDNQHLMV